MAVNLMKVDRNMTDTGAHFHMNTIFSGTFLMLGFGVFFLLLGNAIGLNPANAVTPAVGGVLKFWSWVYMAASITISYFIGAYLSTRPNDIASPGSGMLHSLISWSLVNAIVVGIGCVASPTFRHSILGIGSNSANWLAICTVAVGGVASALGGMLRKYAVPYTAAVTDKERRAA